MAVQSIAIGTVFGRLTVIGEAELACDRSGRSIVQCECGTEKTVRNAKLRSGWTVSCACLSREKSAERCKGRSTHKLSKSNEHAAWASMKSRCTNINVPEYNNYGGRGIQVCDRWLNSFEAFLEDMGPRPTSQHSIDRFPNNDGNYEPSNCRWATRQEQDNNKRTNRLFMFYGKTMTLTQWSEISQVNRRTVMVRLKRGWPEKEAFWTPAKSKRHCDV
jgi:hypothetical protein